MVRREAEVTKVEQRLAKLRELLERRRTKKQEIVELQTKVVINEADGLGFYESPTMDDGASDLILSFDGGGETNADSDPFADPAAGSGTPAPPSMK